MKPIDLRWTLCALGALAGLGVYVLFEFLPEWLDYGHTHLFIGCFTISFFASLLALIGPVRILTASLCAALIALFASLLMLWMGLRFEDPQNLTESPGFLAFFVLTMASWPFVIAGFGPAQNWLDYEALFDEAWGLFVRGFTALVFLGVFWLAFALSDALLKLVDISLLSDLAVEKVLAWPLSGFVLGLALAVLLEMTAVISTLRGLVIRLFCLLIPLVTTVTLVFAIAVPISGLGNVFRGFSAAGTMLGVVGCGVALVAASVGARASEQVTSRVMVWATRGLSLLLPVLALLGCYAIWLRLEQYGWSPERLLAVLVALVMATYALAYAIAAFRSDWGLVIRRINLVAALGVMGLSALWMTPVLNAHAISAKDQIARFKAGSVGAEQLALWELKHDWGKAGQKALAVLREQSAQGSDAILSAQLQKLDATRYKSAYLRGETDSQTALNREVLQTIPVRPVGRSMSDFEVDLGSRTFSLGSRTFRFRDHCPELRAGKAPDCAAVFDDFDREHDGDELLLFLKGKDTRLEVHLFIKVNGVYKRPKPIAHGLNAADAAILVQRILDGDFELVPSQNFDLSVGGERLDLTR